MTDAYGDPVIGANVLEKGTLNGTITDVDGNFSLQVPESAVLQITYIGYLTQEIPVNNRSNFTVQLVEDTQKLEEVVIVGYGTQRKVNLTGSIASVKTDEINNIPSSNLSNSLAGRAPGVTITTTSGLAGGSSQIRMRGSFGEPLFVINNVIRDKAVFDALDPNEVENISFLKDAASASIYGSRAGNGVVLVTTKNGRVQKPEFQYKGSVSTSRTTRPVQSYSATDELIWANRVAATLGQPQVYDPNGEVFEYFKDKSYDVNDYVWRNPSSTQHNLSVNGGNERISYFMLVGYHDENGSYKNLDYQKYNFRSDITAHISNRFKVNFNLSGNQRNYNRFYWPYDKMDDFNVPDFYRSTFDWTRLYPFYVDDNGNPVNERNDNPVLYGSFHPVEMVLGNRYQKETRRTLDGQVRFDLDLGQFVDGLSTSFLGQYTGYDRNLKAFITHNKSYRFKSASGTNPYVPGPIDPTDMIVHNLSSTYEGIKEEMDMDKFYQINWFLRYDKTFGKHAVSALLVYEQSESSGKFIEGKAEDLLTPSLDQIYVTSNDTQRRWFDGKEWQKASQSVVGRFNYTYADKYIAEFSFREDGNSRFGPGYRWGFFPSGSLAWRISEEKFMQKIDWLSNLKVRGSYGTTGDDLTWEGEDKIEYFLWRSSYGNSEAKYAFGDNLHKTILLNGIANPYLTWAKLEVFDIGVDFGLFGHRLTGEFDYFVKTKSDILKDRNKEVPSTYGAKLNEENYAKQRWHGSEFSLRWTDTYNKLNYSVYANMGYVKDKWLVMDEEEGLKEWQSAIGCPYKRLEGYIAKGIIRTQEQLDALPDGFTQFGRKPVLGTILFEDIRGEGFSEGADGKIDENDKTFLSDKGTPRINYGFGFNLEWKGISLDAHF
ncbi:MAG: SusC/RagA family TonB-linked outer membrane protein [Tannerellaceae bacterium]|nr:SusC/RagA family TonB-linked outer membrane protein [Tannerellaceae bacterium]